MKRFAIILFLIYNLFLAAIAQPNFYTNLADAVVELIDPSVIYDGNYVSIGYPNGDVPNNRGVCTDLVVRAYRKVGIDLQKEVHEDMAQNFYLYPQLWGLSKPDRNIDHRRVPNLMTFFERHGESLSISSNPELYMPGNIVCWDLGNGLTHIGIVVNMRSNDGKRYLIMHNIGGGQVLADCLFEYKIIGHYRYKK